MTLTEFLLARIAEDEATARAAQGKAWTMLRHEGLGDRMADDDVNAYARRFTPARILADREAKCAIVELHSGGHECPGVGQTWWSDEENDADWTQPCPTLRAVALSFADHPDYQADWKP